MYAKICHHSQSISLLCNIEQWINIEMLLFLNSNSPFFWQPPWMCCSGDSLKSQVDERACVIIIYLEIRKGVDFLKKIHYPKIRSSQWAITCQCGSILLKHSQSSSVLNGYIHHLPFDRHTTTMNHLFKFQSEFGSYLVFIITNIRFLHDILFMVFQHTLCI